ncbi:hypothetical protein HOP50_19g83830 [Chloropicon primus]|uniref:Heterogeneous nuclear ribonucleoprotein Q acidic domain-containing protein n=1 Tax=Chloropicon primus TaxID=1764295 RepID=A0A5B8MZV8_9CHLO|nr:hypothetical protein A3770_19p83590 [Chloropicon primus]UPR05036.1 hypothetical protein HOP50_19g83830 [Chloropicon primus]|eukprot:QDZ25841.1 hypothetical protein A3770_19p83590 [Chloropicon primus]
MAWNMIPPPDGELKLQDGDFVDDVEDKDVGEVLDYLLRDGSPGPNGTRSREGIPAGKKGNAEKEKKAGGGMPNLSLKIKRKDSGEVVKLENGTENGNGAGGKPLTGKPLSIQVVKRRGSSDSSGLMKKRNSDAAGGFNTSYVLDGEDEVATPTKKTRVNSFRSPSESQANSENDSGILSRSGSLNFGRPQDGNNAWATMNERIRRFSPQKSDGGTNKGSFSSEAEAETSPSRTGLSFKKALEKGEDLSAEEVRKYSNGSEEAKYLIKSMAAETRKAYFKLIDKRIISEYDVDNMCLQTLTRLGDKEACEVLKVLEKEARFSSFRNVSAYLAQIINNFRHERNKQAAAGIVVTEMKVSPGQNGNPSSEVSKIPELPESIQKRLDFLFTSGQISKSMMNPLLYEHLASLPESGAMAVLVTLEGIDMKKIRNFTAFFISLCNKCRKESQYGSRSRFSPSHGDSPKWRRGGGQLARHFRTSPGDHNRWARGSPQGGGQSDLKDHTKYQKALGVRVHELHKLSPFAMYTPASVALKLQNLHDKGITFVTLLDDRSWKTLSTMEESIVSNVVSDVGDRLKQDMMMPDDGKFTKIRNLNAFFLDLVKKQSDLINTGLGGSSSHGTPPGRAMAGGFGTPSPPPFFTKALDPKRFDELSEETRKELDMLVASSGGLLDHGMFDMRAVKLLARLGDTNMKLACTQLRKVDTRRIRNLFAFFLGMCRNYINGELLKK